MTSTPSSQTGMSVPRLMLSATRKSSGKTIVSIGLAAAMRELGKTVQPFKKGPDYIDGMWLSCAAQRPCYNLDFHTQSKEELIQTLQNHTGDADISLIEGTKGFFDGVAVDGRDSNAAMADILQTPVVLVVDTEGMTRGIAPLLLGYQSFENGERIQGVILNNVSGDRHGSKLQSAIQQHTDLAVMGSIQRDAQLTLTERHIGLLTNWECDTPDGFVQKVAAKISEQVDLTAIESVANTAIVLPPITNKVELTIKRPLRIGIARDSAFSFYYQDDLQRFEALGATLHFFDTLQDSRLPDVDALWFGGGFPETHLARLSANRDMLHAVAGFIESDGPVYAECGGLMYLTRGIQWQGNNCPMVGALPVDTVMTDRPVGRGYVSLENTDQHLWGNPLSSHCLPGHEFHYSRLENIDPSLQYAYSVRRGFGIDGQRDGLMYRNVLANYAHMRDTDKNPWISRFLAFVENVAMDKLTNRKASVSL